MARIVPDNWQHLAVTGAAARERETLALLEQGLPDAYTVYHGVHWTRLHEGFSVFGEADFVIVSPSGRALLVEQKTGFLRETPKGLVKVYLRTERNVAIALSRTVESLHRRFTGAFGAGTFFLEELLYCPDHAVKDAAIAGVNPARIVDATRRQQLVRVVLDALPANEPKLPCAPKIHAFLADELALTPDASALVGAAGTLVTRLSDGLATWARRLEFAPFRLRVTGTAGSGKTQLALQVMKDAAARGQRTLYVCFNRPLADYIARIAPACTAAFASASTSASAPAFASTPAPASASTSIFGSASTSAFASTSTPAFASASASGSTSAFAFAFVPAPSDTSAHAFSDASTHVSADARAQVSAYARAHECDAPPVMIANYHQLCDQVARAGGHVPDFSGPDAFARLEQRFAHAIIDARWQFDVLIVDEGQDFRQEWVAALARLLRPGAAWWWLEDPLQNLYMRAPVDLPGWTVLKATTNYRSPRDILDYLRDVASAAVPLLAQFTAGSPFDGSDVSLSIYDDTHDVHGAPGAFDASDMSAPAHARRAGAHDVHGTPGAFDTFDTPAPVHARRAGMHDVHGAPGAFDASGTSVLAHARRAGTHDIHGTPGAFDAFDTPAPAHARRAGAHDIGNRSENAVGSHARRAGTHDVHGAPGVFDASDTPAPAHARRAGHDEPAVLGATQRAITQALALGFRRQDIVVLSYRGREGSRFTALDQIGPHRLRSFTGQYDLFGNPQYRDGDILLDSIYRFKGQAAPCVILTEIDFDAFDERAARKLFVGATRATMKLMLVASPRAARYLQASSSGPRT